MFPESFDTKFSRVACVLLELRHLPPKIFQNPPGHEYINVFQKKIAMGLCADSYPVNRIISKKHLKAGNPIILMSLYYCNILFKQAAE